MKPMKVFMLIMLILIVTGSALATITGSCVNCHTMHNSQDGTTMNYDNATVPNTGLLRGTCLGCHAQAGASALVTVGDAKIPQVFHTGANDLAGGNFAFITGDKGSGASDGKGHNISKLTGTDETLTGLPGGIIELGHEDVIVDTTVLTCAGVNGCHGYRTPPMYGTTTLPEGIKGAHHANADGQLYIADKVSNSYRFLAGVKGLEDSDWQYTRSASDHNEYYGITTPIKLGCSSATSCHKSNLGVSPPNGTMSQYCSTCHGNFHTIETTTSDGIGTNASSPFVRHPTDLALSQNSGDEYSSVTSYNINVPVARPSVPATSESWVNPYYDSVTCMSCHVAHASDYSDMLRWDYGECNANVNNSKCGCFYCHTTKDGE